MEKLTKGTIEFLVVPVTDTLGNLEEITSATFDIRVGDDEQAAVVTGVAAIVQGFNILCLVDTTEMDEGYYDLFVSFVATPETPYLGPHRFRVDD